MKFGLYFGDYMHSKIQISALNVCAEIVLNDTKSTTGDSGRDQALHTAHDQ